MWVDVKNIYGNFMAQETVMANILGVKFFTRDGNLHFDIYNFKKLTFLKFWLI